MLDTMTALEENDKELQTRLDNFVSEMNALKRKREDLDERSRSESAETEHFDKQLKTQHAALGGVQAEMEQHQNSLTDRQNMVVSLAGRHKISDFDSLPIEPARIASFQNELNRASSQAEKLLRDHMSESESQIEAKREEMTKLRTQASQNRTQSTSLRQQVVSSSLLSHSLMRHLICLTCSPTSNESLVSFRPKSRAAP